MPLVQLEGTRKARVKGTEQIIIVNKTPKRLMIELEKNEEDRDQRYIDSMHTYAPYFDPNIHEGVDVKGEDKEEEKEEKKPAAKKSRVRVTKKEADTKPDSADKDDDDTVDEDADDDDDDED